jgi:hypothetical protein
VAVVNNRRRQRPADVRTQLLNLATYNFQARSKITGSTVNANDVIADNAPQLRTLLLRGWAVATI